jgi:predicted nucleotidyltransferase
MSNLQFNQETIEKLAKKHHLQLLILHGSHAKGTATDKSDIDIGILSNRKIDHKAFSGILNDFEDVFGDKFDPAFLNNAEPMICLHTALGGKPLFEAQKGAFTRFKMQAMLRYMDTKKFRELEKAYIKRAVGRNTP